MRRRNRGVALITAVLITALAGMVAASLAWDSALDMRRTVVSLDRDQAMQIALGAESWLEIILKEDDPAVDHLGEIWASELPGLPIEGGEVFGAVEDLQGRFNINNLVDQSGNVNQEALEQFQRRLDRSRPGRQLPRRGRGRDLHRLHATLSYAESADLVSERTRCHRGR